MNQKLKKDAGKARMDLVPPEWIQAVAEVLTFGIQKGYRENSWREVEVKRYVASTMRHLNSYRMGEWLDAESGLPHLAHLLTNVGFLLTLESERQNSEFTPLMEALCQTATTLNDPQDSTFIKRNW